MEELLIRKDNRLLPQGWRSDHAHAEATRPIGVDDDADFQAGRDTTHYALPLGSGRYAVEVRLLFQSLSSRYVAELLEHDTPEVKAFAGLYSKADRSPITISTAKMQIEVP